MSFIVRWKRKHLDEKSKEIVATFYVHARGTEIQHSPLGLYRSMLHQLLPYAPGQLATLTAEWLNRKDICKTLTWSEQKLRECFNLAVTRICDQFPLTLVVDGLDELGKRNAVRFIEEFGTMVKALGAPGLKLKICFSCRHYPNIYPDSNSYLYPGLPSESSFCVKVEEKNGDDIRKLISTHRALRRMDAELSTETKKEVLQLILNRAKGVFQWVVLVLEQVDELLDYGPTSSRIKQEVERIPAGLEALYDSLLISSNPDPGQTLKLFQWLLFTVTPLSVAELRDALAIEAYMAHKSYSDIQSSRNYYVLENMKQSVRSISKGLVQVKVHIDKTKSTQHVMSFFQQKDPDYHVESQSVEFIHESVRDYLLEKGLHALKTKLGLLPGTPQYSCQFQLSRSCIGYLNLNEITCTVRSPDCHYALGEYAHFFWIHHVMKAEQDHIDQQDLLAMFKFRSGTQGLPSNYVVEYSNYQRGQWSYLYHMAQKNDQLRSTLDHWASVAPDGLISLMFYSAWVNRGGHLTLPSILCLAGIFSALKQMRVLQPDLYRTSERRRLLMCALLGKHEQIIQDYLKDLHTEDADLSMSPGLDFRMDGLSPLGFAVETKQEDLLQTLLDAGADPNLYYTKPDVLRTTCLFSAAELGHSNMVQSLLHAGADASLSLVLFGEKYRAPLHTAVGGGHLDVVKALLESDADPNIADEQNRTPLWYLVNTRYHLSVSCFKETFKLLLDHGADPNHRGSQHSTVRTNFIDDDQFLELMYESGNPDFFGCKRLLDSLLNKGAYLGIIDGFNTSALEAILFHRLGPFHRLAKIDVLKPMLDWTDGHGYTTLMCELMIRKSFGWQEVGRFREMLEILMSGGKYDFNVQAHDGNNLLSVAVILDAAEIAEILLMDQTVNPNLQDINGHTPLMKAADYGYKDIVKLFLGCERTAVGIVDRCGWTAFDWAVHAGNAAVATWLRNAMA